MNDRLKKLLKLNTYGNESDSPSMENLSMMINPIGSVGKGVKSGQKAIEVLKRMMSKGNNKSPIDPTRIQRWLFEQNMQRTNAPQQFANKQSYVKASDKLEGKKIQDAMDYLSGNKSGAWNKPKAIDKAFDTMKNDDEKILYILKNMLGASPVAGLTQALQDSSNVETRKQTTLPEQSERLRGSGFLGKQGNKAMETLSDIFGNKTAEQDSLQTDALERLTGSGLFGKKGQNLPQILKAILKQSRP